MLVIVGVDVIAVVRRCLLSKFVLLVDADVVVAAVCWFAVGV